MADSYARPKTRGELRDALAAGTTCEVASSVAEITTTMLKGWLNFEAFTTCPSENQGWTLYEPHNPHR